MNIREFWSEFRQVKIGLVGLGILGATLLLGIFGPLMVPFPGATNHWRDIEFWQDNPQSAPPVWTNVPWGPQKASSAYIERAKTSETPAGTDGQAPTKTWTFNYRMNADQAPRDLIVAFEGTGSVSAQLEVIRPDGKTADIYRAQLELTKGIIQRVSVTNNGAQSIVEFVSIHNPEIASQLKPNQISPNRLLFSPIDQNMLGSPTALKGEYQVKLTVGFMTSAATVDSATLRISGYVSGLLGTDAAKRDIFTGILVSIRWAMIIGLLTSIITVLVGVFFGVVAAYFGGVVDWIINRVYEFFYLMPVLPFLIVISAVYKPSIFTLIIIICVFFWTGAFKPVYSMALQLREETFVEASRALGSGKWRIILRHIAPMVLPYSFAVMALSIPGIIVYEATISLLGLGDPNIVTLGQILESANKQGAVINQLWWWVVSPGLMIALMGMSFAFVGTALDKILHPKLKTR